MGVVAQPHVPRPWRGDIEVPDDQCCAEHTSPISPPHRRSSSKYAGSATQASAQADVAQADINLKRTLVRSIDGGLRQKGKLINTVKDQELRQL